MMRNKKIEVIEPNTFVRKYKGDLFRENIYTYLAYLDPPTIEEHLRQIRRITEPNRVV